MVVRNPSDSPHDFADRYIEVSARTTARLSASDLGAVIAAVEHTRSADGTVWACGNGGSASIASHLAVGLSHNTARVGGSAVRAISISSDSIALSALANDATYELVFERQLKILGRPGDLLVAISVSGKSPNTLAAAIEAKRRGMRIVALVGLRESPLGQLADHVIHLGTSDPATAEDAALCAAHAIYGWFMAAPITASSTIEPHVESRSGEAL